MSITRVILSPFYFFYALIRRFGVIDVTRLMHLPQSECRSQRCPKGYEIRAIDANELNELRRTKSVPRRAGKPKNLKDHRRALVAVFFEGKVIAFMWMAKQNVGGRSNYSRAAHLGTSIDMPDGTAFVFNAWTSPKHRGKRLVAAMMTWAIRNRVVGAWACLTMIDWSNHKSIGAFEYVGMRRLGTVIRIGRGPLQISFVPRKLPIGSDSVSPTMRQV